MKFLNKSLILLILVFLFLAIYSFSKKIWWKSKWSGAPHGFEPRTYWLQINKVNYFSFH